MINKCVLHSYFLLSFVPFLILKKFLGLNFLGILGVVVCFDNLENSYFSYFCKHITYLCMTFT